MIIYRNVYLNPRNISLLSKHQIENIFINAANKIEHGSIAALRPAKLYRRNVSAISIYFEAENGKPFRLRQR